MTYAPAWPRRPHAALPALAVFLLVVQLAGSSAAGRHQLEARPLDALGYLLLLVGPLALLAIPRSRVLVCVAAVGAASVYLGLGYPRGPVVLSAVVSLVLAVVSGRRVAAWVIGAAGYLVVLILGELSDYPSSLGQGVGFGAWLVVVLLLAELPRRRAEQVAAARRATQAERDAAAGEGRLALARDLHDTIGHSLSLIAVQAGVALHLLDEHPEQARPALTAIRSASKDALEEVRTVLAVLRAEGEVPRAPAATLSRVPELVEAARAGGLAVTLTPDPLGRLAVGLPHGVDAAAFRVVQEGLTNVIRHADPRSAAVTITRDSSWLAVEVVDDGVGLAGTAEGRGLLGMRERARALGGTVEVSALPDGGSRVSARFPLVVEVAP